MKLHLSLKVVFSILFFLNSATVLAETEVQSPLVEVRVPQDTLAPYRDRRGTNGLMIGIDYEALVLKNFFSVEDGSTYSDLFGSDAIPFLHFAIDYKYNFFLGSLTFGPDYGTGTISKNGSSLDVERYGVGLRYIADILMPEPYVAPYVGVNAWRMSTVEKDNSTKFTGSNTTGIAYNYTVGLLVQLDWLDHDSAKQGTFGYGLQNTYLDIYVTQYTKTGDAADVDTETDLLWGAGLKLEF
ncbi:MAG TPA: hypothetical protein VN132_06980 [Bdellovibrio sp.]|nr:hypothetical protein [Bdellovibrio sp.]